MHYRYALGSGNSADAVELGLASIDPSSEVSDFGSVSVELDISWARTVVQQRSCPTPLEKPLPLPRLGR